MALQVNYIDSWNISPGAVEYTWVCILLVDSSPGVTETHTCTEQTVNE